MLLRSEQRNIESKKQKRQTDKFHMINEPKDQGKDSMLGSRVKVVIITGMNKIIDFLRRERT